MMTRSRPVRAAFPTTAPTRRAPYSTAIFADQKRVDFSDFSEPAAPP